jgi:hypothetical protein
MAKELIITVMLLTHLPAVAGSKEYVNGLGWRDSRQVTVCLQAVGAEETDDLTDWKWDDFVGCMGSWNRSTR